MIKLITLIFSLSLTITSYSQISNDSEISGKWIVEKTIEKPSNVQFKPIIEGFENATFNFKENNDFELTTTNNSELFKIMMSEVAIGTKWKFVKDGQIIKIGNQNDNYSAMFISVKTDNGNIFFHLEESGLTFQMKKIE